MRDFNDIMVINYKPCDPGHYLVGSENVGLRLIYHVVISLYIDFNSVHFFCKVIFDKCTL